MSTASLQSVPPAFSPEEDLAVGPAVPSLRRTRQDVLAELSHCRYLQRLVRARTDLLVASALGPLDELPPHTDCDGSTPWEATRTPTAEEISRLVLDHAHQGVGTQLEALTDAGRRLAVHEKCLDGRLEGITDDLVRALTADPGAVLRGAARR